jgi:hypothetical protein
LSACVSCIKKPPEEVRRLYIADGRKIKKTWRMREGYKDENTVYRNRNSETLFPYWVIKYRFSTYPVKTYL